MGDGGILSTMNYKNMWPKLKDLRSDDPKFPMKTLHFCCEKRVATSTTKIWVGAYCSMAMAAHAHDLIAETFSWGSEGSLHYGRSDVLQAKAQELREALGDYCNIDEKETRKKVVDFANNYALMFPCSDSRQILMECFRLWVTHKGVGCKCIIRIEKPRLPGHEPGKDRLYPPTLLPPVHIPESLRPRESPHATREPPTTNKQGPCNVLGTNELKAELDVDPDLIAQCVMSAKGDEKNTSTIPCIHQQWTWWTRMQDEINQRRWFNSHISPYAYPNITFAKAPRFTTESFPDAHFSLLNLHVYDHLNVRWTEDKVDPSKFSSRRRGTAIREYDDAQYDDTQDVQTDDAPMVDVTSDHDDTEDVQADDAADDANMVDLTTDHDE